MSAVAPMLKWLVALVALVEGGWMFFDGSRGLLLGDYVTPQGGPHAGELGPWAKVVAAVGIPPRSIFMKSVFTVWGLAWMVLAVAFATDVPWAGRSVLVAAVATLWFVPWGTAASVIELAALAFMRMRL